MAGKSRSPATSKLEWAAASLGALIALALLGLIGREAASGADSALPAIVVTAQRVVPTAAGYVVEVEAHNRSGATAAGVEIEGVLAGAGGEAERSRATIDYVPGRARRRAGLIFAADPRGRPLELRATGYQEP